MFLTAKELESAKGLVARLNSIFKAKSPTIDGFFGINEVVQPDGNVDYSLYFSMPKHNIFVEMGQSKTKEAVSA